MVLKDWGSEEEVFEFAAEGRFEFIRDESEDIPLGIVRDVIWWITPTIALQYAVNTRSQCSVFALTGTPADDVKGIVESIEQGVHPWTLKELRTAVNEARGPAEVAAAVLRAGMGSPQSFDRKFYKVMRTAIGVTTPKSGRPACGRRRTRAGTSAAICWRRPPRPIPSPRSAETPA